MPQYFQLKPKKRQREEERLNEVMMNNMILLKHLMEIAGSKRVDDGVRSEQFERNSSLVKCQATLYLLKARLDLVQLSEDSTVDCDNTEIGIFLSPFINSTVHCRIHTSVNEP